MSQSIESESITRAEFQEAVASTLASIHHFYREVGRLYVSLRDSLQAEPNPLVAVGGLAARPSRSNERANVRNWFGELFEPRQDDEDAGDEDLEVDDDEEDEVSTKKKGSPVLLDATRPLLVIKLKLYDPSDAKESEPQLQYAVVGDWARGTGQPKAGQDQPLEMAHHMLRRIIRAFDASTQERDHRVTTKAMIRSKKGTKSVDRQVSFRILTKPHSVALFDLDSAGALDSVSREIQDHWTNLMSSSE